MVRRSSMAGRVDSTMRSAPARSGSLPTPKDIAYAALAGSQWLAVIGDRPPDSCDEIADLTVSPGGGHVAFVGRKGQKWQAIVDGNAGPEYDRIGLPGHLRFWVSPDGKRLAYAGRLGSKWQVVVDGRPDAACDEIEQDGRPLLCSVPMANARPTTCGSA